MNIEQTIKSTDHLVDQRKFDRPRNRRCIVVLVTLVLAAVVLAVVLVFTLKDKDKDEFSEISIKKRFTPLNSSSDSNQLALKECEIGHEQYDLHNASLLGKYRQAAVAVDSIPCSTIGKEIFEENGTVVDAAIATGLCNGIFNAQSMGIGGGHFMLIYIRKNRTFFGIDAREKAPQFSNRTMFVNKTDASSFGGLASGVPGELAGYWKAHQIAGRLAWSRLFKPTIDFCRNGVKVSAILASVISSNEKRIRMNEALKRVYINRTTDKPYGLNDLLKLPELAQTLEIISANGSQAFYDGQLSDVIVKENNLNGGIITLDDLRNYEAADRLPIDVDLTDEYTAHVLPAPSSGVLVTFILNIMKRFNLKPEVLQNTKSEGLFLHRLSEAFRHAFAKRSYMGDSDFVNNTELIKNVTDPAYIDFIHSQINDARTFEEGYYNPSWDTKSDHGTSHMSIIAPNGDAVALTSTINNFFGANYAGDTTGIIYNDQMDDFSTPGQTNGFGYASSSSNFIEPGKRPMSSMSPMIVTNKNGDVRLVLGASGGSKIITAVASVTLRNLWLGQNIKESIDALRVHDQLSPNILNIEGGFSDKLAAILEDKGHKLQCLKSSGSVCQGIERRPNSEIWANSDYRKGGTTDGF